MEYEDLPIKGINEIKDLKQASANIGEWKRVMRTKAVELGISDKDILRANREGLK